MAIRDILLLGDARLYQPAREMTQDELATAKQIITDLHDTMLNFRNKYGFGRAIAAPQIGEAFRVIYMNFDNREIAIINPSLEFGAEQFQVWDDCMSFPGLEVRLTRFQKTTLRFKDLEWNDCVLEFEGDLSELIQHEYDHLDGILAVQRAVDDKSFRINRAKSGCY